jgi:FtsP/CotA-like multicopper oxidase with cupredoxin domain
MTALTCRHLTPVLLALAACGSPGRIGEPLATPDAGALAPDAGARPPEGPPAGWDREVRLPELRGATPGSGSVEVTLTAAPLNASFTPGLVSGVWAYNGSVPGPLIRARVGDRVVVSFVNRLPEDSTIHWHGIRLPPGMDGVPHHSQEPVPPGGQFRYEFVVRDPGLFWYHPHVQSAKQVGDGLYGALLVEDPAEPAGLGDEVVMVLSDISLDPDGKLQPPDTGGGAGSLFGREGETVLVNGRVNPVILAHPGRRQRWRLVNTARSRYFQLAIAGHTFTRIGGDGGFLEKPVETERLVLTPGQRADVLVTPRGEPGTTVAVRWVPYDRGYGSTFRRPEVEIATLRFVEGGPVVNAPVPERLRTIAPLDATGATLEDIHLTSTVVMGKLVMGINGKPADESDPIRAHVGETQVWNITNEIDFAHPFHIHGFFFQVLSTSDGKGPLPAGPLEWRDTADVPAQGKMSLVVRFDERPGMWMFHCHILDHADAGMMGMIMLDP